MQVLPFAPSLGNFRVSQTLIGESYAFDVRWNDRDASFYMTIVDDEEVVIAAGIRIVLGAYLGRRSTHHLFRRGAFFAIDQSHRGVEAAFDDLGTRVVVVYAQAEEIILGRLP